MPHPLPGNATWRDFQGEGAPAHFYHANGFPSGAYEPLLTKLSEQFNLSALNLRPTWPNIGKPPQRRDWNLYADDLIAFIEEHCQPPILGIGHSMGAACTLIAAQLRPDLFSSLVLIELAMMSRGLATLARFTPKSLMNLTEPASSTLKKNDLWSSREDFIEHCRQHRAYKRFDDEALRALAQHSIIETSDGRFKLAFPKQWEAHNYTQPPNLMDQLQRVEVPCVAIRGKPSMFFTEEMWREWRQRCPKTVFMENPQYGHLFPMEGAGPCFELVMSGLAGVGVSEQVAAET